MTETNELGPHATQLRLFARALTGSQKLAATLTASFAHTLQQHGRSASQISRAELYRLAIGLWNGPLYGQFENKNMAGTALSTSNREQRRVSRMSLLCREAFLLTTLAQFSVREAASILGVSSEAFEQLLGNAVIECGEEDAANILIIEDEYFVAQDLERVLKSLGHKILAKVRTHQSALEAIEVAAPDLIVADVQLADGSSGVDAVNDILSRIGDRPVVFVTAFSNELLTGQRPAPTVLINKPFTVQEVRSAISQLLYYELKSAVRPSAKLVHSTPVVMIRDELVA